MFATQTQKKQDEFMGVMFKHWPEDRIFNLLLKFGISDMEKSVVFIKEFLSTLTNPTALGHAQSYKVSCSSLNLDMKELLEDHKLDNELEQGHDYKIIVEDVYNKSDLLKALREMSANPNRSQTKPEEMLKNYTPKKVTKYYMTIFGTVKLIEILPKKIITQELNSELQRLLFWVAVMKDTNFGDNVYGTV